MGIANRRIEALKLAAGTVGMVFDHHAGRYRFGEPNDGAEGYFGMKSRQTFDSLKEAEAYAEGLKDGWFASGEDQ